MRVTTNDEKENGDDDKMSDFASTSCEGNAVGAIDDVVCCWIRVVMSEEDKDG